MSRNRTAGATLTALTALTLTLSACGADSDPLDDTPSTDAGSSSAITIGSANFPESELLAEVYAQALEAEDVEVERSFNIGARELYLKALDDGSIDLIPEYNGALLSALSEGGAPEGVSSSEEVLAALQDVLPDGTEVLEQSEAQDKDTLSVTRETADEYGLTSITDLADVADQLVVGAGPEWAERYQGLLGLKEVYGVQFKEFRPLDAGGPLTKGALLNGSIDVGNIFSTDSAIETNDLVVLEDPEDLYLAENILPLIRSELNDEKVSDALNAVSAALTTENLTEHLARIQVDKEDTATVAKAFLTDNDLA